MKVKNAWAERGPFGWFGQEWHEVHIMASFCLPITGSFIGAAIIDGTTDGSWPMLWVACWLAISAFIIFAHHLSGFRAIDNNDARVDVSRYSYYRNGKGSADLLREVMRLPKQDQSLFPRDLPLTLSQNLHPTARKKINEGISSTLKKIEEKNKHLLDVEMKAIPTEHVLAALEDAQKSLDSDIRVYKEFL